MGFYLIFLSIFLIATTHKSCLRAQNTSACSKQERLSLVTFKHSVEDKFGMLSSWVGNDCCQWKGVECDVASRSVVSLSLKGNAWQSYSMHQHSYPSDEEYFNGETYYLFGNEVDSSLAELEHLKYLDLSGNMFSLSQIPGFIGSLKQLSYLNLSNGNFYGNIPHHIGNLSSLEVLDLSNGFYGLEVDDIAWAFRLPLLKHLDLSGVDLSGAKNMGKVLYMIPSLKELSLSWCQLSNAQLIDRHLNSSRILSNIQLLDLSMNPFGTQLPVFLQNMSSLSFLDLSGSDLSFAWNLPYLLQMIPSLLELHLSNCGINNRHLSSTHVNFSTHSKIQYLDLGSNSLHGRFPHALTNMSSLRVLDLQDNTLHSKIPIMPNLLKLDISSNNFKHIEHVGIWRQCHLKQLMASLNSLMGEMIGPSTNTSECSQYALEMLYLDENKINGSIPKYLEKLGNLRVLDLSSNTLIGPVPEALGRLRSLQVLNLNSNKLSGPIPTSIGRLASLQVFSLHSNLLNGTIPDSFGQLSKVDFVDASRNVLEGIIFEAHFANLSKLKYLDIGSNRNLILNISHEWIPPFQLETLTLSSCKIEDEFPQWLQNQMKLKKLVLSNTSISGLLPIWLLKKPIIPILDLSHNKLSGPLTNLPLGGPSNRFGHGYTESLFLQNNLFNRSIPKSLCRRIDLEILDLSKNELSGKIPDCLENLQKLRAMILGSNRLSGFVPSSIGRIPLLSWLHFNDNNFIGDLPKDLGNLHALTVLDLGNNNFSGKIPDWIEDTSLIVLRLHSNNLTGRIPRSLCKNPCLQILDVAHNRLKGPIPRCFGDFSGMVTGMDTVNTLCHNYIYSGENMNQVLKGVALEYTTTLPLVINMDLSSNELVGQIPNELTTLLLLVGLNLSHNHLSGSIPRDIGNMTALISLDFSENKLTGMIPQSMVDLNFLSNLNLSHNNLSGQIPTGLQLQTLTDPSIYIANEHLCGSPLPKSCSNHEEPTTTRSKSKFKADDEPNKVWFYLDIMFGFATGFWGVIGVLLFKKQWRHNLFRSFEVIMDKIYVAVAIRVARIKRQREVV